MVEISACDASWLLELAKGNQTQVDAWVYLMNAKHINKDRDDCAIYVPSHVRYMWQKVIMHTKRYAELCDRYFGGMMHHDPARRDQDTIVVMPTTCRGAVKLGRPLGKIAPSTSNPLVKTTPSTSNPFGKTALSTTNSFPTRKRRRLDSIAIELQTNEGDACRSHHFTLSEGQVASWTIQDVYASLGLPPLLGAVRYRGARYGASDKVSMMGLVTGDVWVACA